MFVVCVTIWVKPGHAEQFIEATRLNHLGTRKEPGNVRYDFLQKADDPNQFMLYEVYHSAADLEAHQKTSHYLQWRETVEPWMAQKRQGVKHNSLLPSDNEF